MTTASHQFLSTITGASEGGTDQISLAWTTTNAVYSISHVTLATNGIAGAQSFIVPNGAQTVLIKAPSTNTASMRIGASTADSTGHVAISSVNPTILSVTTGISTVVLWTTATTAVPDVRVVII